ncbi:hypothetical protein D0Y65_050994 [Glycine soja]|uniref:Uncharacterized protein n=1 Tax=Glycine soja TaxID=3848 RepID=A0A445FEA1_GLYSO|nr:hypothetical protein D0Y65_050994 [Glycine soja]
MMKEKKEFPKEEFLSFRNNQMSLEYIWMEKFIRNLKFFCALAPPFSHYSLTFLFYALASLTPYPYRRYTISIRSVLSLLAGAAEEAADHLGYFRSSGAFLRDALADILGVYIASFALSLFRSPPPPPHLHAFSLV